MSLNFKIYLLVILSGAITGTVRFGKLPVYLKYLTVLLQLTFLSEVISRVLANKIHNTNPVYHFYSPLEYLMTLMVFINLTKAKRVRLGLIFLYTGLILFSILNSFFLQHLLEFNSNVDLVKAPITFLSAGAILLEILNRPVKKVVVIEPELIMICSILWFTISSFVFYLAFDYLAQQKVFSKELRLLHFISNLIYYLLFLIALIKFKNTKEKNAEYKS